MADIFKHGDKISSKERFSKRFQLLKPLVKRYHNPVIVHAVESSKILYKILNDGKLKLPKNHGSRKNCLYMETLLDIDNSIFLSLGFVYSTAYGFKYNLMFDLDILKQAIFYRRSLIGRCSKEIVRYWIRNDPEYLEKLSLVNKKCAKVLHNYFHKEYNGKVKEVFEFWKIEKEFFHHLDAYPKKKILLQIIKKVEQDLFTKYPNSMRLARTYCFTTKVPEIICQKEIELRDTPSFLGFYFTGSPPQKIKKILHRYYSSKIFYDGRSIRQISELK